MDALNNKILVVDAELAIRQVLETRLTNLGYFVILATNGKEALDLFNQYNFTFVILDIVLPQLDGYDVCTEIRKTSQVPIIILTALGDISERVMGLDLGADDYVIKPFSPKELEARIRSVLRRYHGQQAQSSDKKMSLLQLGSLVINFNKRQVFRDGVRIKLTGMEFSLLELLITNSGKRLSRTLILNNVWGYTPERYVDTRVVDVHISRLRSKLEDDPSDPNLILTARGTGYMFPEYLNKQT
jgi:OmpR family response regulator RpaB|tara:strand:+ start:368 stop:1096 length:729 start_codon:yes stop_codon:yes gene_type:complete